MRLLWTLSVAAVVAWLVGLWVTVIPNPEVSFWRGVMERRDREIAEVRERQPGTPIILFTGGSSTAFSIDPRIIEEHCGVPAFNLGLPAACGSPYLIDQAMRRTRRGDVLVICIERDLLAYDSAPETGALALSLGLLEDKLTSPWGGETLNAGVPIREFVSLARPGARYSVVLALRGATGHGYRYTTEDIRYRGRLETRVPDPAMVAMGTPGRALLTPRARQVLRLTVRRADEQGVRVFYSMPWRWTAHEAVGRVRAANHRLLEEIGTILPALDDGTDGAWVDRSDFSDSHQHLTGSGAAKRTLVLAPILDDALSGARGGGKSSE